MRKLPQGLPDNIDDLKAQLEAQSQKSRITQVREYRIITALFGGGVEPNHADPITVVRATEVRGHLRFWWRATRGGQYATPAELQVAEAAIWGAAATPDDKVGQSAVWVEVISSNGGTTEVTKDKPFHIVIAGNKKDVKPRPGSKVPPYVAFPLQPTREEAKKLRSDDLLDTLLGVSFTIKITYPSKWQKDVEAALWAWETFGGIGARTRRGFGALSLERVDGQPVQLPTTQTVRKELERLLRTHVVEGTWPEKVPHLRRDISDSWFVLKKSSDPYEVWKTLSGKLKKFRQQRPDGHSDWPEPNAIRRKAGVSARGPHAARKIDAAPRGSFGLPIVFHMAHDSGLDQTLQIDDKQDRFASPLILKPIACGRERDNDRAIGLALILHGTEVPDGLYLKGVDQPITRTLTIDEAKRISVLNGETDVLKAFLRFLQR
jgi:CRISPR-associated protein Cmr1